MKTTLTTTPPLPHIEFDTDGNYKAPIEYQDHDHETTGLKSLVSQMEENNQRIKNITDSVLQMVARIK